MRLSLCVFFISSTLSACGGYSVNGNAVTHTRCNEGNGCTSSAVKDADPKTFESLQGDYAKDRLHVYFSGVSIQEADAQSFKVLSDTYANDNSKVYFRDKPIPGADSGSFAALSAGNYGRDKRDIYILGDAIRACDVASFRWLNDNWQVDRKCAYTGGTKLPNAHPGSFVVINDSYAKDAEHVYSAVSDKAIEGADIATFSSGTLCGSCGRDKNRCYDGPEPAPCGLH
jgi:DKNYY family